MKDSDQGSLIVSVDIHNRYKYKQRVALVVTSVLRLCGNGGRGKHLAIGYSHTLQLDTY